MQVPTLKLNTGTDIPAIGLGCWAGFTDEEREKSVPWILTALKAGYRRIDTALHYGTEQTVREAIKQSGIPREEFHITTKLPWHHPGREEMSVERSLANLGTDYIDLYLIHWPQTAVYEDDNFWPYGPDGVIKIRDDYPFTKTWAAMEKIYESGRAKAIGVSNFSIKNLEILLKTAKVVPADNQVELHPYFIQEDLVQYCHQKGITVTAYAPTGYEPVLKDPLIVDLAKKYNVTPVQLVLAWHLARGVAAVPNSKNEQHQKENLQLPTLAPEDVKRISGLDKNLRVCNKPDERGICNGWTVEQLGW